MYVLMSRNTFFATHTTHNLSLAMFTYVCLCFVTQIMTPMYEDENCLYIMSEIEKKVNFQHVPPCCTKEPKKE